MVLRKVSAEQRGFSVEVPQHEPPLLEGDPFLFELGSGQATGGVTQNN